MNVNQIAKGNNIAGQVMRLNDAYCASKDEKKKSEIIRKIMHLEKMQRELKVISSNLDAQKECMDRYEEASLRWRKHYGVFKGNENCFRQDALSMLPDMAQDTIRMNSGTCMLDM